MIFRVFINYSLYSLWYPDPQDWRKVLFLRNWCFKYSYVSYLEKSTVDIIIFWSKLSFLLFLLFDI